MYFSSTINVRFLNYVKFIFWNYILPLKLAFPLHAGASEKNKRTQKKHSLHERRRRLIPKIGSERTTFVGLNATANPTIGNKSTEEWPTKQKQPYNLFREIGPTKNWRGANSLLRYNTSQSHMWPLVRPVKMGQNHVRQFLHLSTHFYPHLSAMEG